MVCAEYAVSVALPLVRVVIFSLIVASTLTGCGASEVARRPSPHGDSPVTPQGRSWETVFLSPTLPDSADARADADALYAGRNDAARGYAPNQPQLATAQWPEPDRASLSDRRYLSLPRSPNLLIYYDRDNGDWYRYHRYPYYRGYGY